MSCQLPGLLDISGLNEEQILDVLPKLETTAAIKVRVVPGRDCRTLDLTGDRIEPFMHSVEEASQQPTFQNQWKTVPNRLDLTPDQVLVIRDVLWTCDQDNDPCAVDRLHVRIKDMERNGDPVLRMDVAGGVVFDGVVTTPGVDGGHVLAPAVSIDIRFIYSATAVTPPVVVLMPTVFVELTPDMVLADVARRNRGDEGSALRRDRDRLQLAAPAVMLVRNDTGFPRAIANGLVGNRFTDPVADSLDCCRVSLDTWCPETVACLVVRFIVPKVLNVGKFFFEERVSQVVVVEDVAAPQGSIGGVNIAERQFRMYDVPVINLWWQQDGFCCAVSQDVVLEGGVVVAVAVVVILDGDVLEVLVMVVERLGVFKEQRRCGDFTAGAFGEGEGDFVAELAACVDEQVRVRLRVREAVELSDEVALDPDGCFRDRCDDGVGEAECCRRGSLGGEGKGGGVEGDDVV